MHGRNADNITIVTALLFPDGYHRVFASSACVMQAPGQMQMAGRAHVVYFRSFHSDHFTVKAALRHDVVRPAESDARTSMR